MSPEATILGIIVRMEQQNARLEQQAVKISQEAEALRQQIATLQAEKTAEAEAG